jgi:hypothetical protein
MRKTVLGRLTEAVSDLSNEWNYGTVTFSHREYVAVSRKDLSRLIVEYKRMKKRALTAEKARRKLVMEKP